MLTEGSDRIVRGCECNTGCPECSLCAVLAGIDINLPQRMCDAQRSFFSAGGVRDEHASRIARDATPSCLVTVSMLGLDGVDDGVAHHRRHRPALGP